jgi:hypothetical protein
LCAVPVTVVASALCAVPVTVVASALARYKPENPKSARLVFKIHYDKQIIKI